jgi:hypothetical protein
MLVITTYVHHNARLLLHMYITMHGYYYICISQCTVIITYVYHNARLLLHM